MNDFDDATRPADATTSARDVPSALSGLIDRYGPGLFYEADRLKLLLQQECPDASREIAQVMLALTEDVPQRLLAAHGSEDLRQVMSQLVDRLSRDSLFDRSSAALAVRTWAGALAMPSTGLDAPRAGRTGDASPTGDFGFVVTPLSAGPRTTASDPSPSVSRYGIDERPGRASPVTARSSPPDPMPEPDAFAGTPTSDDLDVVPMAEDTSRPIIEPIVLASEASAEPDEASSMHPAPAVVAVVDASIGEVAAPASDLAPIEIPMVPFADLAPSTMPETLDLAESAGSDTSPPVQGPRSEHESPQEIPELPDDATIVRVAEPPSTKTAPAVPAATTALPPARPTVSDPAPPPPPWATGTQRPSGGRRSLTVAVIVAVVAIGGLLTYRATRNDAAMPTERPASIATANRPAALPQSPPLATPNTPAPDRAPVETSAPVDARSASAPKSESRDVATAPAPAAASPQAKDATPASSPTPTKTETPVKSATVVEPRAVAPSRAATAPTIVRVDAPRIAAGKPFVVAVAITGKPSDLAGVERRVVAGDGVRDAPVMTPLSALKVSPGGSLLVPFRSIGTTSQSTVQFTLVARSGARSAPRTVAIRASDVESPLLVSPPSLGLAACTRSTCGSVVSIGASDANGYETILRMDDRSIQVIRQGARWRVGSRVQRVGNRYVTVASP